jgi:hypothetical protein
MTTVFIFTLRSLRACIERLPDMALLTPRPPARVDDVVSTFAESFHYRIHKDDTERVRRLIFTSHDDALDMTQLKPRALRAALERAFLFSERAREASVRVPISWGQYKDRDYMSFFACPRDKDPRALRWIAQVQRPSNDVCFWRLTSHESQVNLADYDAPEEQYFAVVSAWPSAFAFCQSEFAKPEAPVDTTATEFELRATALESVPGDLSYSAWLPRLTSEQRGFVERTPDRSVKLKGPAGSGKTLALELKALYEVDRARRAGHDIRVLFATHSWALATEVDRDLRQLDESGAITAIDVFPLITMAHAVLPGERWETGLQLLGEDSFSGKQEQLQRIAAAWDDFLRGDWLTYRDEVSDDFTERVESEDPRDRQGLVWDCLVEFSCVLGSDGIFPGINAEPRYLSLPRAQWMMPLHTRGDKRAILYVYEKYLRRLLADGLFTTDQVINDFLNYLETFAWNVRRREGGYDLIFVDELHLFDAQERLALQYLTRDPSTYPKLFMALDPRQSPWEVFVDLAALRTGQEALEQIDRGLGEVADVDLPTIHRSSPQILALIQHLNHEYPALELGGDWNLDYSRLTSTAAPGPVPSVIACGSRDAELSEVFVRVGVARRGRPAARTAIAIVDEDVFPAFRRLAESASDQQRASVSVIASRDDVEMLQYAPRRVVVGPVEYLAGLQFDRVVVAGLPDTRFGIANAGHRRRRFLSLLYLAVSRASHQVEIIVNDEDGGVPEVLERAVERGVVQSGRGRQV